MNRWKEYAQIALEGKLLTEEQALSVLHAEDDQVLAMLDAAFRVRNYYFGKKVKLNMLINAKSGLCPEDCGYCSQSMVSSAPIRKYPMLKKEVLIEGAKEAVNRKAGTYCIVASGRGPTEKELDEVIGAVKEIKEEYPLKICACLGILNDEQARRLQEAGVDRYNHNVNTSGSHYEKIATTHTYEHRIQTIERIKQAGISPCSGCIVGLGETKEQIVEIAYALREMDVDSIPVNFLHPIPGTPLEDRNDLTPMYCLKVLCLLRFICPTKEIRVAGGREIHLRSLQPLAFYVANSVFLGDYLTTKGQDFHVDYQMIEDLGFEIDC